MSRRSSISECEIPRARDPSGEARGPREDELEDDDESGPDEDDEKD